MKLVFCGTPEFAVDTLEAVIAAGHVIVLAVTQPDRMAGRGLEVHPPPVKRTAVAHGIAVVQPEKIRNNVDAASSASRLPRNGTPNTRIAMATEPSIAVMPRTK